MLGGAVCKKKSGALQEGVPSARAFQRIDIAFRRRRALWTQAVTSVAQALEEFPLLGRYSMWKAFVYEKLRCKSACITALEPKSETSGPSAMLNSACP